MKTFRKGLGDLRTHTIYNVFSGIKWKIWVYSMATWSWLWSGSSYIRPIGLTEVV